MCGGGPGRWWGSGEAGGWAGPASTTQQPPVHVTLASYSVTAPPPARHSHALDTSTRQAATLSPSPTTDCCQTLYLPFIIFGSTSQSHVPIVEIKYYCNQRLYILAPPPLLLAWLNKQQPPTPYNNNIYYLV